MFTGLVRERGRVVEAGPSAGGGVRLLVQVSAELASTSSVGDSVCFGGACLTLTSVEEDGVAAELSPETLKRTTLGGLVRNSVVNIEPALRVGEPLGGHWVQGHVDTKLTVTGRAAEGEHVVMRFELPRAYGAYVVEKGSVTIDGVSLTVSACAEDWFEVALIPHTLEVTTLNELAPGDRVNFEVDILAKYVERALSFADHHSA